MSQEPRFVNIDFFNQPINPLIDLAAVKAKLDPLSWREETGPIEISDDEMTALAQDAVNDRFADMENIRFLNDMLPSSAPVELHPALRRAFAHALMETPRQDTFTQDVHTITAGLCASIREGRGAAAAYHRRLAAQYDWPVIAKRNSEDQRRKAQAEIRQEAERCWHQKQEPKSDEVRAALTAHRQRLRKEEDCQFERDRCAVRIKWANRGYGLSDDDDFFLTPAAAKTVITAARARREQLEIEELLADPMFRPQGDGQVLDYFDPDTGLLPCYPGGGILAAIGPMQNFKTTAVVELCCAALAHDPAVRVLFLAGELPDLVRGMRNAYGEAAGLAAGDLDTRFLIYNGMPAMGEAENADRILELVEKFRPSIVTMDTWARAIYGLREISDEPGDLLAEEGAIGRIAARGVLVVIIGHCALDEEKRLRGNSSADAACDARLWIKGEDKGFKIEVLKMRGTTPGHAVYATVPALRPNLTPQERATLPPPEITWCTKAEYDKAVHGPRRVVGQEPDGAEEPVAAASERPMTATEKTAARVRRFRAKQRERNAPPSAV